MNPAWAFRRVVSAAAGRVSFALRERTPEPRDRDYRRFIILCPGRSGSQMLVQRCDSHPQIRCFGELLSAASIYWGRTIWRPGHEQARLSRDRDPARFLNRHLWHRYPKPVAAVGFKLLYPHLLESVELLEPLFSGEAELSILWLERHNRFETFLSTLHAHRTRMFHAYEAHAVPAHAPIEVDPDVCRHALEAMDTRHDAVGAIIARSRVLKLYYEELIARPAQTDSRICTFLNVSDRPLQHSTQQFAKGPLRERVTNLPQLQAHFSGTRWESYFADDGDAPQALTKNGT